MKNLMILLVLSFAFGCAGPVSKEDEFVNRAEPEAHPCLAGVDDDRYNCGACADVCSPSDADRCLDGRCSCGENPYGNGPELCQDGSDCRNGQCVPTDPSGAICEMDDECGEGGACVEGRCVVICFPEQGRLACNGRDDNCDGCIDGAPNVDGLCVHQPAEQYDIVFFVDPSGSMREEIGPAVEAMKNFSDRFSDSNLYRFSIVLAPSYEVDGRAALYADLTDFDTFAAELAGIERVLQGREPIYDAVYEVGTGELPISWREGSTRIMIAFTDEEGQSYRSEFGLSSVGEQEMCGALTHGEVLIFFTLREFVGYFNECAGVLLIDQPANQMAEAINRLISDPCK